MGGRGDMKFTTGGSPGNFSADLGITESFLNNKLSVTLKFDDIFDTKKFVINTENVITNPISRNIYSINDAERRRGQRYMSVNINYNFANNRRRNGIDVTLVVEEVVVVWIWIIDQHPFISKKLFIFF